MKRLFALLLVVLAPLACSGRSIAVNSAPSTGAAATLTVTNNLAVAVNVYIVSGGTDHFLKQVAAKATEALPVVTVSVGTTASLKATAADGSKTYTKGGVTIQGSMTWTVP